MASCDLDFVLAPQAQIEVTVDFRRSLLPEWHRIQESVRALLLSFEVSPPPQPAAPTAAVQKKWTMPIQSWRQAMSRFIIEFEDRLEKHIN